MSVPVEQVTRGRGGWVRYATSESPVATYIRYAQIDGRVEPVELYVERIDDGPLSTDTLRQIPLGRINARVTSRPDLLTVFWAEVGPDLRRAARHFATAWSGAVPQGPLPEVNLPEPEPDPDLSAVLEVPHATPSDPYPDEFFEQVAAVYRRLVPWVRSPAALIADANGVKITTVHRWVKVARQRGHLPPVRQGKAG